MYNFLLVFFHYSYVWILYHFQRIIIYFLKFELSWQIKSRYCIMHMLVLTTIYLQFCIPNLKCLTSLISYIL